MCDHQFAYAGVRYCDGRNNLPGGGAKQRYYAHVYYCQKCMETKWQPIADDGYHPRWNSYGKIEFGATPGNPQECGVPERDRH